MNTAPALTKNMKTLIVITETKEFRLECHRFHATVSDDGMLVISAQDAEGSLLAVFYRATQAHFDGVVKSAQ